jgi:hypothetical protein
LKDATRRKKIKIKVGTWSRQKEAGSEKKKCFGEKKNMAFRDR